MQLDRQTATSGDRLTSAGEIGALQRCDLYADRIKASIGDGPPRL
jgi:hypothetical protein